MATTIQVGAHWNRKITAGLFKILSLWVHVGCMWKIKSERRPTGAGSTSLIKSMWAQRAIYPPAEVKFHGPHTSKDSDRAWRVCEHCPSSTNLAIFWLASVSVELLEIFRTHGASSSFPAISNRRAFKNPIQNTMVSVTHIGSILWKYVGCVLSSKFRSFGNQP